MAHYMESGITHVRLHGVPPKHDLQGVINIIRGVIITSLIDSPLYRPPRVLNVQNTLDVSCTLSAIEKNCPGIDRHIIFIHTRGLTSVSIIYIIIIKSLKFKMWRYGIGEAPPKKRNMIMMQKKKKRISNMRQNVSGILYNHG